DDSATRLRSLAAEARVVGIGETGLDFYREHAPVEDQRRAFEAQITISIDASKALVLHVRDAHEQVAEMLRPHAPFDRLVFHCFSSGVDDARTALELGGYISFAGNLTFKSAESLRDAARWVPLDRMLIETDSPFLAPVPHRGKRNEPAWASEVGTAIAHARSQDIGEVASRTTENAKKVFGLAST
ncbi:MAG: TatD family hydrolase, partial [Actinobacteria bacterium]|nr:TatD family hydrolase [Actinomycetota bacterium]